MADQEGIDVSRHQGKIDWKAVAAAGATFAYIKATEGGSHVDQRFPENWSGAKAAGIRRGAYHFFNPRTPVQKQVTLFKSTVTLGAGDLPPVLDKPTSVSVNAWLCRGVTCLPPINSVDALKKACKDSSFR